MHLQEITLFDLDLDVKVTQNVTKYPLHHVTYTPAKFPTATSNSFGGDAFTRTYILWHLTLGSRSYVPSTSCDLYTCKVWRCYVQELRRRCNTLFDIWPWPKCQGHTKCCPVTSTSCDLFTCKVCSCYVQQFRRCIYKKHYSCSYVLMHAGTEGRRPDFGTKLIYSYPFF